MDYKGIGQNLRNLIASAMIFDAMVNLVCRQQLFSNTICIVLLALTIVAFMYVATTCVGLLRQQGEAEDEEERTKFKKTTKMVFFLTFLGIDICRQTL